VVEAFVPAQACDAFALAPTEAVGTAFLGRERVREEALLERVKELRDAVVHTLGDAVLHEVLGLQVLCREAAPAQQWLRVDRSPRPDANSTAAAPHSGQKLELHDRLMATARADRHEPRLEDHLAIPKRGRR
jgi:hypothetical protein